MSNQASEDELEQKLLDDKSFQHTLKLVPMSQRELMTFELARYINALIRTKKLKLLAEVRERVVGEKTSPNFDNEYGYCDNCEFQPTDGTKRCLCYYDEKLRKKQRAALTKLEAEL